MCVLHNLSYRLDAEVPTRYRQLEYNARNAYTDKSSTGCFSNKSDRMTVRAHGPGPTAPSTRPLPPEPETGPQGGPLPRLAVGLTAPGAGRASSRPRHRPCVLGAKEPEPPAGRPPLPRLLPPSR